MKRLIAILLVAMMLLSVAACKGKEAEISSDDNSESAFSELDQSSEQSTDYSAASIESGNSQASKNSSAAAPSKSTGTASLAQSAPDGSKKYPTKLTVTYLTRGDQTVAEKLKEDAIVKYIEKMFNIEFKLIFYPSPTQSEVYMKLNMLLASGQIPDMMISRTDFTVAKDVYDKMATAGYLVDVKKYISTLQGKYPNITKIVNDPESSAYLASNGNLYSIPRKYNWDHAFIYRQDWLDELGLAMPKTQTDFYNVLKAFKEANLDKKGTTGLTMTYGFWFDHIFTAFTGYEKFYKDSSGNYKSVWRLDTMRDALRYCRKLYSEGLLDQNVFTNTPGRDELSTFESGKAGVLLQGVVSYVPQIYSSLIKTDSKAKLSYGFWYGSAGAAHVREKNSYYEATAINSKTKDPGRLFDLVEFLLSDSGTTLTGYGIPDVNYTQSGNTITMKSSTATTEPWLLWPSKHPIREIARADATFDTYVTSQAWGSALSTYYNNYCVKKTGAFDPTEGYAALLPKAVSIQVGNKPELTVQKWEMQFITGKSNIDSDADWKACWNDLVINGMQTLEEQYSKIK